jgi:Na+/H+ antiporter NhaD/arsenite permease-like protein
MGPILRRKKVVSLPLGNARHDFFFPPTHEEKGEEHIRPARVKQKSDGAVLLRVSEADASPKQEAPHAHVRQESYPPRQARVKMDSLVKGILKRKQVSLDLMSPEAADFFAAEQEEVDILPTAEEEEEEVEEEARKKPFYPLQFAPRTYPVMGGGGHGHGGGGGHGAVSAATKTISDEETAQILHKQVEDTEQLKHHVDTLTEKLQEQDGVHGRYEILLKNVQTETAKLEEDTTTLTTKLLGTTPEGAVTGVAVDTAVVEEGLDGSVEMSEKEEDDEGIVKAKKGDYYRTGVLACIMLGFSLACCLWHTHIEPFEHFSIGLGCVTTCMGNIESQDFFFGDYSFVEGQIIELQLVLDPNPVSDVEAIVQIVGVESDEIKASLTFGPPDHHYQQFFKKEVPVNWENPEEEHVINVYSSDDNVVLSFSLNTLVQQPLAEWSVLIAAIIMIIVYFFILIEVIHRTLIAIFGSMVALLFLFIIRGGNTESIRTIMLFMEWSTLGLLFGMMIIVGELSHTGVFEWVAVRILVASKGSYNRLFILLCLLTAVSSAFLDNVTTMLLVAPVTIDMCNIIAVDPRPYLIGEVLLSNIGGTATLIGDPPNIIIGSSFSEIGFMDFIINVLPCIFFFCVPTALVLNLYVFRYFFQGKMPDIEADQLKKTYPIYDQPRLLIAGTVAVFVILLFFLHPVHHKDTAWIALFGAFITMAFTNPHDVQDALRNYVEWDVMLFFAGLFVLVEACAEMGLLRFIGEALAKYIESQEPESQLAVAITLVIWVSAITSAFLDNIPYTATMIPIIQILSDTLPETLPLTTLAWALSFGACLGGNGTLLGASANIVTAGISTNKGFKVSFLNFFYPGMLTMLATIVISNLYMLVVYVWI